MAKIGIRLPPDCSDKFPEPDEETYQRFKTRLIAEVVIVSAHDEESVVLAKGGALILIDKQKTKDLKTLRRLLKKYPEERS